MDDDSRALDKGWDGLPGYSGAPGDADEAVMVSVSTAPGEWLVTHAGRLRRWDGFVARGEGAAEAARLAAENRFIELDCALPAARAELAEAEAAQHRTQAELAKLTGHDPMAPKQ